MWKRAIWVVVILLSGVPLAVAQDETKVVIDAGNIVRLGSVAQVDFDNFHNQVGEIENGWFAADGSGVQYAVMSQSQEVVILNQEASLVDHYSIIGSDALPNPIRDMAFRSEGDMLISLHVEGGAFYVVYRWVGAQFFEYFQFRNADIPLEIWISADVWLEMSPFDTSQPYYLMQLAPYPLNRLRINDFLTEDETRLFQYGPNNDPESVIRIGRIEPPLAVTVTEDGRVKRWNMETGEVTVEAQVDPEDGLPIYGALNAGGDSDLVWRDPASTALHILSFETGEDRTVVPLNGTYIPFIFLTQGSDVIMGVNIDDEPIVVAWNVATGERYDLGPYRECNRPPDMVRLSQDGTTLVIGCDTGLDVWRINALSRE